MKQAGKVHWLVLVGILGLLTIAFILLFAKESPTTAANRFMTALAKGDVDTLVSMSYYPEDKKDELRKKWEFATKEASPYYRFVWKTRFAKEPGDGTAAVSMDVIRDAGKPSAYDEKYELPLVSQNGKWLVDVASISRTLYPALPR